MENRPTVKDITMENMVVRKQRRWALKMSWFYPASLQKGRESEGQR